MTNKELNQAVVNNFKNREMPFSYAEGGMLSKNSVTFKTGMTIKPNQSVDDLAEDLVTQMKKMISNYLPYKSYLEAHNHITICKGLEPLVAPHIKGSPDFSEVDERFITYVLNDKVWFVLRVHSKVNDREFVTVDWREINEN